jgi:hypothetical protein
MFSLSIDIDSTSTDALLAAFEQAPRLTNQIIQQTMTSAMAQMKDSAATYPGPVKYPIEWASERQRKAFFATNGFGGGIPYQRSGRFGEAWELNYRALENGGQITITNTAKTKRGDDLAQYIVGARQQPFHRNTGWPRVDVQMAAIREELIDSIMEAYFDVIDSSAGKQSPVVTAGQNLFTKVIGWLKRIFRR